MCMWISINFKCYESWFLEQMVFARPGGEKPQGKPGTCYSYRNKEMLKNRRGALPDRYPNN